MLEDLGRDLGYKLLRKPCLALVLVLESLGVAMPTSTSANAPQEYL